jgi:3-(3-hydroxy-phenyl)propionate hydroxylase/6-hydroxy-3-succinoylpyridine 3-monooxygenase
MVDVLVVGGGPVGMVTALGLARAGVRVRLIEAQPALNDSPRAAVYHWSVLDGLARIGLIEDVEGIALKSNKYTYVVKSSGERISFSMQALRNHTARPYNLHLGQHRLVEIVSRNLQAQANAAVSLDRQLVGLVQDSHGVTATARGANGSEEIRAKWLVGADGAGSTVRKLLNLSFDGMTWPERFIATNLKFEFAKYGFKNATFLVDSQFGSVIVPLDDSGSWRCTYMESRQLPEERFLERIPAAYREVLPGDDPYVLDQAAPYRMHQRSAPRYRTGRVVLAGDAAHSTNPTGGLGLTSGLFDSYLLQECLSAIVLDGAHDSLLTRYSDVRRDVFINRASPQAVANKNLIFHANGDDAKLAETLAQLRKLGDDDESALSRLMFTKSLETPRI